ncbi:MAG: hypothetical protein WCE48_05400, partial [Steroidobacteraceae bacterium]
MTLPARRALALLALAILSACAATAVLRAAETANRAPAAHGVRPAGCLPTGNGYLRARLRGALDLDLAWDSAEIECEGGLRPDGRGIRVSIAGPRQSDGRRMRFVLGIAGIGEGQGGRGLPANLTLILENESRLFTTQGADKCTIDDLTQERVGALGGAIRRWRVIGRGFCTGPASSLAGDARIV